MPKVKRNSLFPLEYDEISLVDDGAAGSASVLIMKRKSPTNSRVVAGSGAVEPSASSALKGKPQKKGKKKKKKDRDKDKKSGGRSSKNPCSTKGNKTGAKDGKSTRSKNWKEEKHPRDKNGKMKETSSASKAKNGKGGTTKAKLDRACRREKVKKEGEGRYILNSSLATWDSDAHIRALMERTADNGR